MVPFPGPFQSGRQQVSARRGNFIDFGHPQLTQGRQVDEYLYPPEDACVRLNGLLRIDHAVLDDFHVTQLQVNTLQERTQTFEKFAALGIEQSNEAMRYISLHFRLGAENLRVNPEWQIFKSMFLILNGRTERHVG